MKSIFHVTSWRCKRAPLRTDALLAQALAAERRGRDYDRRMPDRDRRYWHRRAQTLRAFSAEIIGAWRAQEAPPL